MQLSALERHLRLGRTLNPLSAKRLFDVENLSARIRELRARGLCIRTEQVTLRRGQRIAVYSLGERDATT